MIKWVGSFSLQPGLDPEANYKFWIETHVPATKKLLGSRLKKYLINRVIENVKGEPAVFGSAELWFDDIETARQAVHEMVNTPPTDFITRMTNLRIVIVEEKEIKL